MPRLRLNAAVERAIAAGYAVPPELHKLARSKDLGRRGIKEVWSCRSKKNPCPDYESPISLSNIACAHGTLMRKTFQVNKSDILE